VGWRNGSLCPQKELQQMRIIKLRLRGGKSFAVSSAEQTFKNCNINLLNITGFGFDLGWTRNKSTERRAWLEQPVQPKFWVCGGNRIFCCRQLSFWLWHRGLWLWQPNFCLQQPNFWLRKFMALAT